MFHKSITWRRLTSFVLCLQKKREDYEVVIEEAEFMYKNSRQILDTSGGPRDAKWIFVLSTSRNLYVGQVMFRLHLPHRHILLTH